MKKIYDVVPGKGKKQRSLAKAVARSGRKGDTKIVHMGADEVKALNRMSKAATGKGLTRNPKTGAYEAFKLKKLLKTVAPVVAGIVGGPIAAAAASATLTKAEGGSFKEAALSGLGSWALGNALSGVTSPISNSISGTAKTGLAESAKAATGAGAGFAAAGTGAATGAGGIGAALGGTAPSAAGGISAALKSINPSMAMLGMQAHGASKQLTQQREDEEFARQDEEYQRRMGQGVLSTGLSGGFHYAEGGPVASPFAADTSQYFGQAFRPAFDFSQYVPGAGPQVTAPPPTQPTTGGAPPHPASAGGRTVARPTPNGGVQNGGSLMQRLGRLISGNPNSASKESMLDIARTAMEEGAYTGPAFSPYTQAFWARGAPMPALHNNASSAGLASYFAAGGPVSGPGDGMSDSIPAVIDGQQPAQIASGEYIVPADVVSHLGNGDTNAGTSYLDQQMAAIRQASTGSPQQRNKINPWDYIR